MCLHNKYKTFTSKISMNWQAHVSYRILVYMCVKPARGRVELTPLKNSTSIALGLPENAAGRFCPPRLSVCLPDSSGWSSGLLVLLYRFCSFICQVILSIEVLYVLSGTDQFLVLFMYGVSTLSYRYKPRIRISPTC